MRGRKVQKLLAKYLLLVDGLWLWAKTTSRLSQTHIHTQETGPNSVIPKLEHRAISVLPLHKQTFGLKPRDVVLTCSRTIPRRLPTSRICEREYNNKQKHVRACGTLSLVVKVAAYRVLQKPRMRKTQQPCKASECHLAHVHPDSKGVLNPTPLSPKQ